MREAERRLREALRAEQMDEGIVGKINEAAEKLKATLSDAELREEVRRHVLHYGASAVIVRLPHSRQWFLKFGDVFLLPGGYPTKKEAGRRLRAWLDADR